MVYLMSTSPDAPKGANLTGQPAGFGRWLRWDSRSPGLILLKGLFWLSLAVGALVALALNYEIVWDIWVGTVLPGLGSILDLAERLLDSFFLLVGVGPAFAPIATVYTGFVVFLGLAYFLVRKGIKVYKGFQSAKQNVVQLYSKAWDEWYGTVKATAKDRFLAWWSDLSVTDKIVAAVFMVLIGIPLALLLSFILGSMVANLF